MTELPKDLLAERSVLAAIVLEPKVLDDVSQILNPKSFFSEPNRKVFSAMLSLRVQELPIDLVSLMSILKAQGDLEAVGGGQYLAGLMGMATTSVNVLHHARSVAAKDGLRRLSEASGRLETLARSESPPEEILEAFACVRDLIQSKPSEDAVPVGQDIEALFRVNEDEAVPMPLDSLDGLRIVGGNLCCFAARPGAGKTCILGDIALSASRKGRSVLFASLEMTQTEIQQRLVSSGWGIELSKVLTPNEPTEVIKGATDLTKLPIWIRDLSGESRLDVEDISSMTRNFHKKHPDVVLVIDYLQLISTRMRIERRHELIGHVCRELKRLALNLKIPVIVAAQLGRASEQRGDDSKPRLSDLRESGDIENTCNQIVLIHQDPVKTFMRVAKNRMGPKFTAEVKFNAPFVRFEEFGWQ
jgi:replicative DNA helicase